MIKMHMLNINSVGLNPKREKLQGKGFIVHFIPKVIQHLCLNAVKFQKNNRIQLALQ